MTAPTAVDELTWSDRYAASLMNTFGPPKRVLVRGEGCYVWDDQGKRYLDLLAGIAVNALGHAHPAVVETLTRQAGTLGHVSNFFATPQQIALAERLVGLLAGGGSAPQGRVFFTVEASQELWALRASDGATLWHRSIGTDQGPLPAIRK